MTPSPNSALVEFPECLRGPVQVLREKLANDEDGWRALLPIMAAIASPQEGCRLPEPLKQVAVAGDHDGVLREPLEDVYDLEALQQFAADYAGAIIAAATAVVVGKVNPTKGRTRLVMLSDIEALKRAMASPSQPAEKGGGE